MSDENEKYRCGDLKAWEPSEPAEAYAKDAMLRFDGWLEHLDKWQVDSIAEDISRVISQALEESKPAAASRPASKRKGGSK